MDLGLTGRVAIVGASSRGLGLASARALAAEGARVVLNGRDADSLARAADALGDAAVPVVGDIADPAVPQRLVDVALATWGRLDVVVGNAGGPPHARALEVTDDAARAAFEANALASIRLARAALPHLQAAGWGRICFITSMAVRQPLPGLALSNLARAGLWAWAKTAAQDVAAHGVTINLACPGPHPTDRLTEQPSGGPVGDVDDFGRVVAFLCSAPAAFVNGVALGVDGGAVAGLL
ncbi:SDR family oxidoreductase [Nocardioides sp.]|uniref:SDR family oxidoreductase n=1 Tax=Nocardioides sp. TaxID=35761 RepID=UPI0035112ADF